MVDKVRNKLPEQVSLSLILQDLCLHGMYSSMEMNWELLLEMLSPVPVSAHWNLTRSVGVNRDSMMGDDIRIIVGNRSPTLPQAEVSPGSFPQMAAKPTRHLDCEGDGLRMIMAGVSQI